MKYLKILTLLILVSCGGLQVLNKKPEDIYSKQFLSQLKIARSYLAKSKYDEALAAIKKDNGVPLSKAEKAMRENFIGVINFSLRNYEKALFNFKVAESFVAEDIDLKNQIYLNQSSSYYKLTKFVEAIKVHQKIVPEGLNKNEKKKFSLLGIRLAERTKDVEKEIHYILHYLQNYDSLAQLKGLAHYQRLESIFTDLSYTEKSIYIEKYEDMKPLSLGYMAYKIIDRVYNSGERDKAKDLLGFLKSNYSGHSELDKLLTSHIFVAENFANFDKSVIGVVLPLSGPKAAFGKRALLGIDFALKKSNAKIKLVIRDSKASGAIGSYHIRDLIEKHKVAFVIGGLFPDEAVREYRETKKYGALFMSLSQIYIDKEFKDKLLIEVPGSIESQVATIFTNKFINNFGSRPAIMYSENEKGESYIDSFWSKSQDEGINVNTVITFEKQQTDYRTPVKKLLGLEYPRMRLEEYELMENIHELESKRNIRRIQTLKPQVDFDWVFIPSLPREALQIVPSFKYFDAFNINIIGTPEWRSRLLLREGDSLGRVYFIDDQLDLDKDNFKETFVSQYQRSPKIVELRAYDAFYVGNLIFSNVNTTNRFELAERLSGISALSGFSGFWRLEDNLWIKNMSLYSIHRGKIEKLF